MYIHHPITTLRCIKDWVSQFRPSESIIWRSYYSVILHAIKMKQNLSNARGGVINIPHPLYDLWDITNYIIGLRKFQLKGGFEDTVISSE